MPVSVPTSFVSGEAYTPATGQVGAATSFGSGVAGWSSARAAPASRSDAGRTRRVNREKALKRLRVRVGGLAVEGFVQAHFLMRVLDVDRSDLVDQPEHPVREDERPHGG